MKEPIVIPIRIERLKLWTGWMLETASWLISLALLAASVGVSVIDVLAWLVVGSDALLVAGLSGGLALGLAGIWQLMRRVDRAAKQLRQNPAESYATPVQAR